MTQQQMKPYFDNDVVKLYHGDCRAIPLKDGSVHCVVTSPPYYALRVYADLPGSDWADGWHGCLGNEPSVDQYLGHLLECFREVKRVLRDDGVLWVNIDDTRGSDPGWGRGGGSTLEGGIPFDGGPSGTRGGQPLSLLGIPERFTLAMKADGWIWRDTIIWAKKSSMPESVSSTRWEQCRVKIKEGEVKRMGDPGSDHEDGTEWNWHHSDTAGWADCPGCVKCTPNDGLVLRQGSWRCTSSFEYIYMFVKGPGYYCDGDAVKTFSGNGWHGSTFTGMGAQEREQALPNPRLGLGPRDEPAGANRRNVWNDISSEPYRKPNNSSGHYATFPSDLPRLCIQASTSERGVCPECGAEWARVVKKIDTGKTQKKGAGWGTDRDTWTRESQAGETGQPVTVTETLGWRATCACGDLEPVPATVLDPFSGTATTLIAAQRLGRNAVGMELSLSYLEQAKKRLTGVTLPLGV